MIVIEQHLESVAFNRDPKVVALGNFDGVHRGHQQLIAALHKAAKEYKLKSMLFSFKTHTSSVSKGKKLNLITPYSEKINIIKAFDLDYLYLMEFNDKSSQLSPQQFVEEILIGKLNTKIVVVGFDFRFGKGAVGSAQLLKEMGNDYGFEVIVVPAFYIGDEIVSSSIIRKYIEQGNVSLAKEFLGREYYITGKVIRGKGKGRDLGFATANIAFPEEVVTPKKGVYITKTKIANKQFNSITNVGVNPTFNENIPRAETYIFDFNSNIYNHQIKVEFIEFLREEKKFNDLKELVDQVKRDVIIAKNYFS